MSRRHYIAYGSNLNKEQMSHRCPDAVPEGVSEIKNYQLIFRGPQRRAVATIEQKKGCSVPVAIWSISRSDEKNLDAYEGFPRLYDKQMFRVNLNGKTVSAMAYIMTPGRSKGTPSDFYLDTILTGYKDFDIDPADLLNAAHVSETEEDRIIQDLASKQKTQFSQICPRCGKKSMRENLHHNSFSRRADIYICEACGMEEALNDYAGNDDTTAEWHAVRFYGCCNSRNDMK